MITVGITGGIGSGKSTVSKVLSAMNFPVFNSDKTAKFLINSDQEIFAKLRALFGPEIYKKGQVDKVLLATIIFNDFTAREEVNAIVHPKVREAFKDFCSNSLSPLVFNEAAILFETGAFQNFDKTILVTAPEEIRVNRVVARDNSSESLVLERMKAQWSDELKIPLADFVIVNDEKQPLLIQIEEILKELNRLL